MFQVQNRTLLLAARTGTAELWELWDGKGSMIFRRGRPPSVGVRITQGKWYKVAVRRQADLNSRLALHIFGWVSESTLSSICATRARAPSLTLRILAVQLLSGTKIRALREGEGVASGSGSADCLDGSAGSPPQRVFLACTNPAQLGGEDVERFLNRWHVSGSSVSAGQHRNSLSSCLVGQVVLLLWPKPAPASCNRSRAATAAHPRARPQPLGLR